MGLFDKLLRGADAIHDAKIDAEDAIFRDRSFEHAEQLAESGDANTATITGIRGRYNSTTELVFRLEWNDGQPRSAAVLFSGAAPATLRLGCAVLVSADGDAAVLNTGAMIGAAAATREPGRQHRSVPDPGVDDEAQDMRTLKQLKKWTPDRGVVESWSRSTTFGMVTDNWGIVVQRADGSTATIKKVEVPTYVRWFVYPGAELPIVVDPDDSTKAQGNWPALAVERAGGSWQDQPPAGSIAADYLAAQAAPPPVAMSTGDGFDRTLSAESAEAIEGVTLEQWAQIDAWVAQARIPPADYDARVSAEFGVAAGRWTAITKAWNERMKGDWRLGAAFAEAYSEAQRELKRKKKAR